MIIYIYTHTHIYIYIYTHLHTHTYIYICIPMWDPVPTMFAFQKTYKFFFVNLVDRNTAQAPLAGVGPVGPLRTGMGMI